MRREEELQQEYEDILFKIMMDRVAQAEGTRLLEENQQLLEQSDAEVPQEIQKHAYKTIRSAFSKRTRSQRVGSLRRGLRVAAIAAILIALLTGVTFAAFPDVRAKVFNTILDVHDKYTNFFFGDKTSSYQNPSTSGIAVQLSWIPEEYTLVSDISNDSYALKRYENGDELIRVYKMLPNSCAVDTEDALVTSITIQGYEATLIEKNNEKHILWLNTDTNIVYFISTENVSLETILKISKNIL